MKVSKERIEYLINNSSKVIETKNNKVTVVTLQLPNGFTFVESSGCVDPENYSVETGYRICMEAIKDKLWFLEGYIAQQAYHEQQESTYITRMQKEYHELKERATKLSEMLYKYDNGSLDFTPTCPIELLRAQLDTMHSYMLILTDRAKLEGVDL